MVEERVGRVVLHEVACYDIVCCLKGRIWLDNLDCSSGDEVIEDCSHRGWGINYCSHRSDVGVVCRPNGNYINL